MVILGTRLVFKGRLFYAGDREGPEIIIRELGYDGPYTVEIVGIDEAPNTYLQCPPNTPRPDPFRTIGEAMEWAVGFREY